LISKYLPAPIQKLLQRFDEELVNGSFVFFGTKIIGLLSNYFFLWWFVSEYNTTKWGFVTLCITIANIIGMISILGFDIIVLKYISVLKSKLQYGEIKDILIKSGINSFLISGSIGLLFFVFAEFISGILFSNPFEAPWVRVIAIGIPAYGLYHINNSIFAGIKRMIWYGFFRNIVPFTFSLGIGAMLHYWIVPNYFPRFEQSGILILLSYFLILYLAVAYGFVLLNKQLKLRSTKRVPSIKYKSLYKESLPILVGTSMALILGSGDVLVLGILKSESVVGVYDIVGKLSLLMLLAIMSVNAILPAKFAELYASNEMQKLKVLSFQSNRLIFWISSLLFIFMILVSPWILSLFSIETAEAAYLIFILLSAQFVNTICGSNMVLLKMTDHHYFFRNLMIFAAIFNIGVNFIMIPNYGMLGAAVTTLLTTCLWNFWGVFYTYRKMNILMVHVPFRSLT